MSHPLAHSALHVLGEWPRWATAGEDECAVILTTRVRIARNLRGENFPARMDTEGRVRVVRQLARTLADLPIATDGIFLSLAALIPLELALLVERRAISPQLARDDKPRGAFVWKERDRAILICEEDHVRLTEIVPGLHPQLAYDGLQPTMTQLSERVDFLRDENLGYLTACPANLGAAVRTSLFCHLPALALTGGIEDLASHTADAGFTIRGFWGEGSEVLGNLFQLTDGPGLSHQVPEMLTRIQNTGQEVIEREALARIDLQTQRAGLLRDKVARALAILQSCRTLAGAETMALLSAVRLGIDIGFVQGISRKAISLFTFELCRACMEWKGEGYSNPESRHQRRAVRAREVFADAVFTA